MYVGVWLKPIKAPGYDFRPGDMYLISHEMRYKFQEALKRNGIRDAIKYAELNDVFEAYQHDNSNTVMIIRSGGIGDIIALSSICEYLTGKNIIFVTQKKFEPIFNWFLNNRVRVVDFNEPIFSAEFTNLILNSGTIKRMYCENIIEGGSTDNWYKIFFDSIGVDAPVEWWRPSLKALRTTQVPSDIDKGRMSILICPRASANMRSMQFTTIYDAVRLMFNDVNIYVHSGNVTQEEIDLLDDEDIKVISAKGIREFLLDVYDADLVVSVDTAAIHFREGIGRPALGLYSSFSSYSRTAGYKYTKSVDLFSRCPIQPCFLHQTELDQVCSQAQKGSKIAPCIDINYNKTIVEQIASALREFAL